MALSLWAGLLIGLCAQALHLPPWTYKTVRTFFRFVCPSSLSTSLPGPKNLFGAINNGECKFVKLSPLEVKKRREEHDKQVGNGSIPVKVRKTRKDIGSKRPRTKGRKKAVEDNDVDDDEDRDSDEENRPRKRVHKSAEVVSAQADRDDD
jgi:hypothetical protein